MEFENEQIETVDIKFLLSQNSVLIVKEIFFHQDLTREKSLNTFINISWWLDVC